VRFKVDENLPREAVALLHDVGFEADTVRDQGLAGSADNIIANAVRSEGRALLTLDRGFGDIRMYPPREFAGIVVLRPKQRDKHSVLGLLRRLVPSFSHEQLEGLLWIVEPDRIRFHKP
jgi:predicted nuclease of predicted toxin-antitoxin system